MAAKPSKPNRYSRLIAKMFTDGYKPRATVVPFTREALVAAAREFDIKNIGDAIYSGRYRSGLPDEVTRTERDGKSWIILGVGRAKYEFRLMRLPLIEPSKNMLAIKIPDATPQIVANYAQSDEQALLAKVRYNRLIDIFLGIVTFSLQNHLRTTVEEMGQVELDEVYVGVDKYGKQYVIPVQAKGGSDKHNPVQTLQDMACCREKFDALVCRPISAQFAADDVIALFEMTENEDSVKIVEEKHYRLVPADDITAKELDSYRKRPAP